MAAALTRNCIKCDVLGKEAVLPCLFDVNREDLKKGSSKKEIIVNNLLKALNALINTGEGCVFFHTDDPNLVGLLDEAVDEKMKLLISDNRLFHEVFERRVPDKNHVTFRVKSYDRNLISTLCFNTKESLDKGLDDLSHLQMQRWILEGSLLLTSDKDIKITLTLREGEEVMVKNDSGEEPFRESTRMQAKQIPKESSPLVKLKEYVWEKSRKYITAFSKLPSGGSVFFGISEEKVRDTDTGKETNTGKFKCDGIELRQSEKDKLKQHMLSQVKADMVWMKHRKFTDPTHAVSVNFPPVKLQNGRDSGFSIIEIAVKGFRGVSFVGAGPIAYTLKDDECKQMDIQDWVKYQGDPGSLQIVP